MTHAKDEWALPAAASPAPGAKLPGQPIRLFHQHQGQTYALPLNVIAADNDHMEELGMPALLARTAPPKMITVIIAVEDGMMGPVTAVLDQLAGEARANCGFTTVNTAARHIERARAIADGRNGMMIHVGALLRQKARDPARSAADALFGAAEKLRREDETVALFPG